MITQEKLIELRDHYLEESEKWENELAKVWCTGRGKELKAGVELMINKEISHLLDLLITNY